MKHRTSALARAATAPHIIWSVIFIVAPLAVVVYYAFTDAQGAFTFANITNLQDYIPTFARSISYGIIATIICFFLAYPLAYFISQRSENYQRTMLMLVMLPMWMNFLIRTYSWTTILANTGIINSFIKFLGFAPLHLINTREAVILGMVYNFLPYMILPIYSVMAKLDRSVIEAAQDLGAGKPAILRRIIFPLSLPGVVSGITMVFVPSVSTFYISQKLGGGKFLLVGDAIETQFQSAYNYNLGAALSLVLMVLILICMAVMNRFADSDDGGVIV